MAKMNPATNIVTKAQASYPKVLKSVTSYFGTVPYGQQKVSAQTADRNLAAMLPEQFAQMAATDPRAALAGQARLQELNDRAQDQPPLLAQGTYEGGPR